MAGAGARSSLPPWLMALISTPSPNRMASITRASGFFLFIVLSTQSAAPQR